MRRFLLVALMLVACKKSDAPSARPVAAGPDAAATPVAPAPAGKTETRQGLAWYEDDPASAQADAKASGKPILVDLWAPWCHSCIAMQSYILTDKNFPGLNDKFVLLAVNTEKPENAEFLKVVRVEVWPTFFVLDASWQVRGRWLGSASPSQFGRFLADGERLFAEMRDNTTRPEDPLTLLLAGDHAAADKEYAQAADSYRAAIEMGGPSWPRRPETLVALLTSLGKAKDYAHCAEAARAHMNDTGNAVSAGDFASAAVSCAVGLDKKDPARAETLKIAEKRLAVLCDDDKAELTPDDRADVCATLQDARDELGDKAGARQATERRIAVIEAAQKGLPDDVALLYDWNLADAYLLVGRGDDAVKLLEAREKALPDDYNAPHRLARVYLRLKKYGDGLVAIDRAIGKAYGPRRCGMFGLKADLLLGAGKKDEAKQTLEAQLAAYQALPEGEKLPDAEKAVQDRIAGLK